MRKTLRRSCAACAKAKHGCDLRTPKCSRCLKRNSECIYVNEPLKSTKAPIGDIGNGFHAPQGSKARTRSVLSGGSGGSVSPELSDLSPSLDAHLFDPFYSFPSTRLPRLRVQGLMQHCKRTFRGEFWLGELTMFSLIKNCISVLSIRSESIFKSFRHVMVAIGPH
jgi:hypothetical protein